eukprot:g54375.t1
MGDFNFQVSQSKFDFSQFSTDDNLSGPLNSERIIDVPPLHGRTIKYADKFVKDMESNNLLLLTGLVGKAETSHEGIDHNLITFDFKLPDTYFQPANLVVGPKFKCEYKRKVDMSPDIQTIKDKLKMINKGIQKTVNYAKNERRKKDLLQVNADMKRNPKKAWVVLIKGGELSTKSFFFTKLSLITKAMASPLISSLRSVARRHPFAMACATMTARYGGADLLCQTVEEGSQEESWRLDKTRTMTFTAFGFAYTFFPAYLICNKIYQLAVFRSRPWFAASVDCLLHAPLLYFPAFYIMQELLRPDLPTLSRSPPPPPPPPPPSSSSSSSLTELPSENVSFHRKNSPDFRETPESVESATESSKEKRAAGPAALFAVATEMAEPLFQAATGLLLSYWPPQSVQAHRAEYQILDRGLQRYAECLSKDWTNLCLIWVPINTINFAFVPVHFRIPCNALLGFLWVLVLSATRGPGTKRAQCSLQLAITTCNARLLLLTLNLGPQFGSHGHDSARLDLPPRQFNMSKREAEENKCKADKAVSKRVKNKHGNTANTVRCFATHTPSSSLMNGKDCFNGKDCEKEEFESWYDSFTVDFPDHFNPNDIRKYIYQQYQLHRNGRLGKANRGQLPHCVVAYVRAEVESSDEYVSFKPQLL